MVGIALAHGAAVSDACYVALAHRPGVPLVTADEALLRHLAATSLATSWLGDFVGPTPGCS